MSLEVFMSLPDVLFIYFEDFSLFNALQSENEPDQLKTQQILQLWSTIEPNLPYHPVKKTSWDSHLEKTKKKLCLNLLYFHFPSWYSVCRFLLFSVSVSHVVKIANFHTNIPMLRNTFLWPTREDNVSWAQFFVWPSLPGWGALLKRKTVRSWWSNVCNELRRGWGFFPPTFN